MGLTFDVAERNGKFGPIRCQRSKERSSRGKKKETSIRLQKHSESQSKRPSHLNELSELHQSTAASTWWCGPRPRLGWVEMAVGLPLGSQLPRALPFIFSLCFLLNDRSRAAHSFLKIGRLFSLFLFSCPSLARLRLLILLFLLMSDNINSNPGPIFPCSVCVGNVTWRGKSVQCCTCSKWVHLMCSQLSLTKFRTLDSSHSWSCPLCCVSTRNTVTLSSDFSDMYTSTVQSSLCLLMLHSRRTLVFKLLIPRRPILYLLPLPPHHHPLLLAVLLRLLPPVSGFSNGMLEIFEPEALNYFTFFRPILLILSVSRNPILIHLHLPGFVDSLLCNLIAPTPGLAFSLLMPRTLAAVSSFLSGRAYLSLKFLPLFLCSIPTLIM